MSKVLIPVALIALVLGLGGWLAAQQPRTPGGLPGASGGAGEPDAPGQPGKSAPPAKAKFTVSGSGEGALLVETLTGKSWILRRGTGGTFAWLPVHRVDSDEEAAKFREKEEILGIRKQEAFRDQQMKLEAEQRQKLEQLQQLQFQQQKLQQQQQAIQRELEKIGGPR